MQGLARAGAPAFPRPVNEEAKEEDDEPALPALTHQEVRDDMAMTAILAGDMPSWQSQPGAGAPALPEPVNAEEEAQAQQRPAAAAAAPGAPARLALWVQGEVAAAAAAPAARPATGAKARAKAHAKPHAKARPKAHAKAHAKAYAKAKITRGMQLGCSKCRWTSCGKCRDLGWRQRRAAREAAS